MFPTRKRIVLLHLSSNVIRTTADHPFYVLGNGWTEAADLRPGDPLLSHDGQRMPVEGVADSGEQGAVYHLNPGERPMPDQPPPNDTRRPVIGFAAGTPIRTASGSKPIDEVKPGDLIQSGPDGEEPDDEHEDHDPPRWWERN